MTRTSKTSTRTTKTSMKCLVSFYWLARIIGDNNVSIFSGFVFLAFGPYRPRHKASDVISFVPTGLVLKLMGFVACIRIPRHKLWIRTSPAGNVWISTTWSKNRFQQYVLLNRIVGLTVVNSYAQTWQWFTWRNLYQEFPDLWERVFRCAVLSHLLLVTEEISQVHCRICWNQLLTDFWH